MGKFLWLIGMGVFSGVVFYFVVTRPIMRHDKVIIAHYQDTVSSLRSITTMSVDTHFESRLLNKIDGMYQQHMYDSVRIHYLEGQVDLLNNYKQRIP
jgi:hypothetical protein